MFDQVASQCGSSRLTTLTLLNGRHGRSEHRVVVRGSPVVAADPKPDPNPQGDALVEAWIGRWVITYRRRHVRPRHAHDGAR